MSQELPEVQRMQRNEEKRILAGMKKDKKEKHTAGSSHGLWQALPHVEGEKKKQVKSCLGKGGSAMDYFFSITRAKGLLLTSLKA